MINAEARVQLSAEQGHTRASCVIIEDPLCNNGRTVLIDVTRPETQRIYLTPHEALTLACQLPEVKALIKWAFNVRETMSEADLFVHGEEELKPFEAEEREGRNNE